VLAVPKGELICGQVLPNAVALRGAVQLDAACGAFQRSVPAGGAA
jgi:hypothetical protein